MVINPVLQQATAALRRATSIEQVQDVVRTSARQLVEANGATFVLLEGDKCFYADEDAISPLWKGQRFSVEQCISGWAMTHRQPAVVPDIRVDDRIPLSVYAPTFVKSLVMVPIDTEAPLGAIGVYWSRVRRATDEEILRLTRLAAVTAEALHRVREEGLREEG